MKEKTSLDIALEILDDNERVLIADRISKGNGKRGNSGFKD